MRAGIGSISEAKKHRNHRKLQFETFEVSHKKLSIRKQKRAKLSKKQQEAIKVNNREAHQKIRQNTNNTARMSERVYLRSSETRDALENSERARKNVQAA